MADVVSLSREGELALITIHNPPVNALSRSVAEGIITAVHEASSDGSIQAVILIGSGRTFVAGADLREFQQMTSGRIEAKVGLYPLMLALEDCPVPVVCAIHGNALGGGLELALACHYRVAVASAQLGQPEVKLGLIPGAGGTQRLPRLAGVAKALDMVVYGNPVGAPEALSGGIVDYVVPGDLMQGALTWTKDLLASGSGLRKTRECNTRLGDENAGELLFEVARREAEMRMPGRIAPLKAVEAVRAATRLPFAGGCEKEEELFMECLFSDQSRALIHVFFAEREVAKMTASDRASFEAASRFISRRCVREIQSLVEDGVSVGQIEGALGEFGMREDWAAAADSSSAGPGVENHASLERGAIQDRILYALINEGAFLLEQGLVAKAAHVDILCIRDLGFPDYRGGPMWHADSVGLGAACRRIRAFRDQYGERWDPAPLLERLAARGQSFAEHDSG